MDHKQKKQLLLYPHQPIRWRVAKQDARRIIKLRLHKGDDLQIYRKLLFTNEQMQINLFVTKYQIHFGYGYFPQCQLYTYYSEVFCV